MKTAAKAPKKVGSTHGGNLKVGQLRRLIADLPDDVPVMAEIHNDGKRGWILNVHNAELSGAEILENPRVLFLRLSRYCKHDLNPEDCPTCVEFGH